MIGKSKGNQAHSGGTNTVLGVGTVIGGHINSASDVIRIDGTINGNVEAKNRLIIGSKGIVVGDIVCLTADIEGVVEGNILAKNALTVKSTAKIKGEVTTSKLIVEAGSVYNATTTMNTTKVK